MSKILQTAAINHGAAIKAKATDLCQTLPLFRDKQESLDCKKARVNAKRFKLKKAEIEVKNLVSKITELESTIDTIKPSEELSDHEVKEHMINISKWEHKQDVINNVRIKLDKGIIDLDAEPTVYVLVKRRLDALKIK